VSDGIRLIVSFMRMGMIPVAPGGIPIVDVRDVAAVHTAAMRPGRGPRRYMVSGHFLSTAALTDVLSEVTGRRIRKLPVPGALFRGVGRVVDVIQRHVGVDLGLTYESTVTLTRGVPCDDSRIEDDLGIRCRPSHDTMRDSVRSLVEQGLLEPRYLEPAES
jgi:UDP-glucose 4-epimerase